ncbi:hypothetical protein C8Q73DRAFT_786559 [Cubamyces lactineus]|nr:hypothetical protein C8Q73DRAFT_786559 [Cubamyces lactineus]
MSHHYKPSPARTEPAPTPASRRSSSGYRAVEVQRNRRPASVRPEHNAPPAVVIHNGIPYLAPIAAALGLEPDMPTTHTTHGRPQPERPQLRRLPAGLSRGLPNNPADIRYVHRRVAASHPRQPNTQAAANANANQRAPGHPPRGTVVLLVRVRRRRDADGIDYDDPPPVYTPHPEPAPPPYERHIPVRRVEGSAIREPDNATQPGAPLAPSTSQIGTHRHFPGLDHSAGGVADEGGWMEWMGLPTLSQMWEMLPPMRVPGAPRFPFVERFASDPLYHQ